MKIIPFLVYANLLTLIFSLLLVTFFPSLFALYRIIYDSKTYDYDLKGLFYRFITYFKHGWQKSLIFGTSFSLIALVIVLDFIILRSVAEPSPWIISFQYALALFSLLVLSVYQFGLYLYANYSMSLNKTMISGFLLTIKYPLEAILMVLSTILTGMMILFQPGLGLLLFLSGPVFLHQLICQKIIQIEELIQ